MDDNPYKSSRGNETGTSRGHFGKRAFASGIWIFMGVVAWVVQSPMIKLYEDFAAPLPTLTLMVLHRAFPFVLAAIALLVWYWLIWVGDSEVHQNVVATSFIIAIVVITVACFAFMAPLVRLVQSLS